MSRTSAFKGTWEANRRPYIVLAPDAYVTIQGETSVVTCGECNRRVDVNKYLTGISTEASVDSPPGSATINLSIPDTDVNEFYVDGNFVIIPMMELEIYAKGYYTIGGIPQYYKIFWGVITSVSKSWSNGVTSFTISCKDVLYWWEKTNVTTNPAFIGKEGASTGYTPFQNQFAGLNPYTIIIALAKEAMGDFSITDGSFMSFKPEAGPEEPVIGQYAKDIMAYWQMKFGNIWNALVLYGTSGTAYTFQGDGDVSPLQLSYSIFVAEQAALSENRLTADFKVQPHEIAAFKVEIARAGDVQFFQNDTQSKLSCALTARDQCLYEFYCDTTGDIVFKPPFYNLNVIPNKPVSWINDFEIIDDNINDSEQEVITHMTSSGNAFGGVVDYGLTDEITVPRTGVIDWHLLKRYGWKRQDFQCEWAGNPKKLFWFLIDYLDRVNAKRHSGSITIPMRPELRMGFPVWIPYYDSFYYVNGISHQYSPGGQATTTLTLIAKRSKFLAPANMGTIMRVPESGTPDPTKKIGTYQISFSGSIGQTAGLGEEDKQDNSQPLIIRDPSTGKLLGYPNVVMVYRTTYAGQSLAKNQSSKGKAAGHKPKKDAQRPPTYTYDFAVRDTFKQLRSDAKSALVSRIRHHRYEAGMSNAGLYDYATDVSGDFKEMVLIPVTSILWGSGTDDPTQPTGALSKGSADVSMGTPDPNTGKTSAEDFKKQRDAAFNKQIADLDLQLIGPKGHKEQGLQWRMNDKGKKWQNAIKDFRSTVSKNHKGKPTPTPDQYNAQELQKKATADALKAEYNALSVQVQGIKNKKAELSKSKKDDLLLMGQINVSVRPVSDEFGFEVIGHSRYGRGVFVDRGHIKLADLGADTNELRIQFSPVGGTLTTNPPSSKYLSPQAGTFSQVFEKMQPEDWVTGAASYNEGTDVLLTSANTYSSSVNRAIETSAGKGAVFAEADALRRAITLRELQPTLSSGLDEVGFPACSCMLSRFQWFSVLPRGVLLAILSPTMNVDTNPNLYILSRYTYIDADGKETDQPVSFNRRLSISPPMKTTTGSGAGGLGGKAEPVTADRYGPLWESGQAAAGVDTGSIETSEQRPNRLVAIYEQKDSSGKVIDTMQRDAPPTRDMPPQLNAYSEEEQMAKIDENMSKMNQMSNLDTMSNQEFIQMMNSRPPALGSEAWQIGRTSFPDFFQQLNKYLVKLFSDNYESNANRENEDTGTFLGVELPDPFSSGPNGSDYIDPATALGASGGSLFNRAAQGDVDALNALQNQANWNWGASEKALKDFNEAADAFSVSGTKNPPTIPSQENTSVWKDGKLSTTDAAGKTVSSIKPQIQPITPSPRKLVTDPNLVPNFETPATPSGGINDPLSRTFEQKPAAPKKSQP